MKIYYKFDLISDLKILQGITLLQALYATLDYTSLVLELVYIVFNDGLCFFKSEYESLYVPLFILICSFDYLFFPFR